MSKNNQTNIQQNDKGDKTEELIEQQRQTMMDDSNSRGLYQEYNCFREERGGKTQKSEDKLLLKSTDDNDNSQQLQKNPEHHTNFSQSQNINSLQFQKDVDEIEQKANNFPKKHRKDKKLFKGISRYLIKKIKRTKNEEKNKRKNRKKNSRKNMMKNSLNDFLKDTPTICPKNTFNFLNFPKDFKNNFASEKGNDIHINPINNKAFVRNLMKNMEEELTNLKISPDINNISSSQQNPHGSSLDEEDLETTLP